MTVLSRREFGTRLVAVPLLAGMRAVRLHASSLSIGVTSSSFSDLPRVQGRGNLDDVLRAVRAVGATRLHLALRTLEPAPPSTAPVMGGSAAYPRRIALTPEEIAATDTQARADLRAWRLAASPDVFAAARRRCAAAGVTLDGCSVRFDDAFTDEEIDATFRQVTALGAHTVTSPLTLAMARRLAPAAERHAVSIAVHNQADGNAGQLIDTRRLPAALSISPRFTLAIDVGNLTASNADVVGLLREYLSRASTVVLRDRLRKGGASQPLGEGDTPLPAIVQLLASASPAVACVFEYDYAGLRSSTDEIKLSLDYLAGLSRFK